MSTEVPRSASELSEILLSATSDGSSVRLVGGGTHSGYGYPVHASVDISTEGMVDVIAWEPDDLTVTVGAGARVADIERLVNQSGLTLVMPEHPGRATIGGVLAAGVSSLRRGRLLGTRERVLETTVVTGDGRRVRSGGRVVKNVTGFDLSRLHVGAFGALGVLVSVCLKLWPLPEAGLTVTVDDPARAWSVARPLAVLQDAASTRVYISGPAREVEAVARRVGGDVEPGLLWPKDPMGVFRWSLRVPPAVIAEALTRLPVGWDYLVLHGVGEIRLASPGSDGALALRSWAEDAGGHLVVVEAPAGNGFEPWGKPPGTLELQRALIASFDPARIINPGLLPGGL